MHVLHCIYLCRVIPQELRSNVVVHVYICSLSLIWWSKLDLTMHVNAPQNDNGIESCTVHLCMSSFAFFINALISLSCKSAIIQSAPL